MATIGDGACGMRYQGIVKKLIPSSGTRPAHGFIECVDTCHIYGRDVFLHDQLAASLQVGQAVSFAVSLNKNGMPQAVDVAFEGMPEQVVPQTSATHTVYPPGRKAPGLPGAISAPPQSTLNMPNGQSLLELLLPAVAPALEQGMSQAVAAALINAADLMGISNDMRMQLAATAPPDQAISMSTLHFSAGSGAGMAFGSPSGNSNGCCGPVRTGNGWKRYEPYSTTMPVAPNTMAGPFQGMVKSICSQSGSERAYGFIECDDTQAVYGRDVFLHSQQLADLQVGSRVSFTVQLNGRGMPQAHNVEQII